LWNKNQELPTDLRNVYPQGNLCCLVVVKHIFLKLVNPDMKTQVAQGAPFSILKPATWKIVQALFDACPSCSSLSYKLIERKPGLPCQCCKMPTDRILSVVHGCKDCGYAHEKYFPDGETHEDSLFCDCCTPNHS